MVDLTDETDDNDNNKPSHTLPKVEAEDIPMEEINKDTAPADMESTPVEYGCGMRTRKKPISYEP
eukprot:10415694-Ditylum_brightwellii.AAC.1